ncbi:MAG TPA: endolytic transglycosylase MltG [Candidatus Acidoferrales bacterium]|nr:endolytic transglycosylase MltG [Candidatus Acidoferrales bacterium]
MRLLRLSFVFAGLSFLLFCLFFLAFFFLPAGRATGPIEVRIEPGESFASVTHKLEKSGVISNRRLFSLAAVLTGRDKKIHWGLYRFDMPVAPREVLERMSQGRGVFRRVTIPEGLTVSQIAELLAQSGIVDRERFLREAADPSLGMGGAGVEGYLFPDTYYFVPFASERDVLAALVDRFRKAFNSAMRQKAAELGLTPHEVVILASLIEKETAVESERPLVSAVFHNRLRLNIPLQSDPTVIYGMKNFSGNLRRQDLHSQTPHNTYVIRGLPPTPICNPGLSSLEAALNPAPVPYLYFVSKNDGSHVFSATLAEHNQAVKKYQIDPARQAR